MGKYNENNEFSEFKDEFSKLLKNFFGETRVEGCEYDFVPPLDVFEEDNFVIVEVEIPGVEKSDIEISYNNNILNIFGDKKIRLDKENLNFYRIERSSGKFHRRLEIEHNINKKNISAEYNNGVLKISMEKSDEKENTKIDIN